MKNAKILLVSSLVLMTSACSTIHFKNGSQPSNGVTTTDMHHEVGYQFLELSKPVDLQQKCNGSWSEVTTTITFVDALLGMLDGMILGAILPGVPVDIWSPHTVETKCAG